MIVVVQPHFLLILLLVSSGLSESLSEVEKVVETITIETGTGPISQQENIEKNISDLGLESQTSFLTSTPPSPPVVSEGSSSSSSSSQEQGQIYESLKNNIDTEAKPALDSEVPPGPDSDPNCEVQDQTGTESDDKKSAVVTDTISTELEHTLTGTDNESSTSSSTTATVTVDNTNTKSKSDSETSETDPLPIPPSPSPQSISVFQLINNCTWYEVFELILTGELWSSGEIKGFVVTYNLLSDFQWKVFKILVLICVVNILLIGFSWKVYGTKIVEKFMQPTSSAILLEELRHSIAELKLPKEHSPRI